MEWMRCLVLRERDNVLTGLRGKDELSGPHGMDEVLGPPWER